MKLHLFALLVVGLLLLVVACSDSDKITQPVDFGQVQLVQRPDFVDTRPLAEIQQALINDTPAEIQQRLEKKPPPPPPDPGGDDPNPNPAHKYAYVVGISDYEGTANDLQYCDDDARAVITFLRGEGFTVVSDIDGSASAQNIVDGLTWLAEQAVPGDEIAFYYSGHGNKLNVGSCIISADLYYISHGYIMDIINSANCTKMHIALDACKIGSFLSDGLSGSFVATASNNSYSYDAPDLGHGAWTYYWLEAANGQFDYAEDIASYAEDGMDAWADLWNVRVTPAHTDKYDGSFDI
jgi:hypothetical protein